MEEQMHIMVLEHTHSNGAQEWACPECGRRVLIEWPPAFRKTILAEGDASIAHSGSSGGLHMEAQSRVEPYGEPPELSIDTSEDGSENPIDPNTLLPWIRWMNAVDFEDLWENGPRRAQ